MSPAVGCSVTCRNCGQPIDPEHRFCPWCAARQQRKAVALFPPHPEVDAPGRGLRVSRYFDPADGPLHTRLSIYDNDGRVTCVVALDDATTDELAAFLNGLGDDAGGAGSRRGVLARVIDYLTVARS